MNDRLQADVQALARGGDNLGQLSAELNALANDLREAVHRYTNAGGTGEIGHQWTVNYKPAEEHGLQFLELMCDTIGQSANRTTSTAGAYQNTNDDADDASRRRTTDS